MPGVFTLFSPGVQRALAQKLHPRTPTAGYSSDPATVLLYKMNEGSGAVLNDSSPNGHVGSIIGATWTNGRYGQALHFDGTNDHVATPDHPSLNLSASLTLEAWVRPATGGFGQGTIISKHLSYALTITEFPVVRARGAIWRSGFLRQVFSMTDLNKDQWNHLALTYDGTTLALFVDGVLDQTNVLSPGGIDTNTKALCLGVNQIPPGQNWFFGDIDEVRISNVVRTASELDPNQS